jgi:hypothetical protein
MGFWSPQYLDSIDPENEEIWIDSPAEQARIQRPGSLTKEGDVGAQQIMVNGREVPLSWVPDLLGLEWKRSESVMIVGSAYAPFIGGISRRGCTLPLAKYVVLPDQAYYAKIGLLAEDLGDQGRSRSLTCVAPAIQCAVRDAPAKRWMRPLSTRSKIAFRRKGTKPKGTVPLAPKRLAAFSQVM